MVAVGSAKEVSSNRIVPASIWLWAILLIDSLNQANQTRQQNSRIGVTLRQIHVTRITPFRLLLISLIFATTALSLVVFADTIYNRTSTSILITVTEVVERSSIPGVPGVQTTTRQRTIVLQPGQHTDVMLQPTQGHEGGRTELNSPWVSNHISEFSIAQATADGRLAAKPTVPPMVQKSPFPFTIQRAKLEVRIDPATGHFAVIEIPVPPAPPASAKTVL